MSDMQPEVQITTTPTRVFKVGSTQIFEDESTRAMSNEQVRNLLQTQYPEVANSTIRDRVQDGVRLVEFLPQPGRKG